MLKEIMEIIDEGFYKRLSLEQVRWLVKQVNDSEELKRRNHNLGMSVSNLLEENDYLKLSNEEIKEDLKEIADIVETFYTEGNGIRVPKSLEPIASRLALIHRISLQKTRKH